MGDLDQVGVLRGLLNDAAPPRIHDGYVAVGAEVPLPVDRRDVVGESDLTVALGGGDHRAELRCDCLESLFGHAEVERDLLDQ